jgi:hypothetical protein
MLRGNLLRRVVERSGRFAKNGGLFVGRNTEQAQLGAQCRWLYTRNCARTASDPVESGMVGLTVFTKT